MIRGEKVILRAIEPDDVPQLWEWMQDEELMRLRDYPMPPTSLDQARREFEQSPDNSADHLHLAITTLDGELIGETTLRDIDQRNRGAIFTIAIGDRKNWGHGYGSDATRCLMKYAFEQMNLHRIDLFVHATNERAIKAYEKYGFQHDGRLREAHYMDGKYSDVLLMGLLYDDFKAAEEARTQPDVARIPAHM